MENLKTYVTTNTVKMGVGPTAWRATTKLAKQEMFGAATQALHKDEVVPAAEEVEEKVEEDKKPKASEVKD